MFWPVKEERAESVIFSFSVFWKYLGFGLLLGRNAQHVLKWWQAVFQIILYKFVEQILGAHRSGNFHYHKIRMNVLVFAYSKSSKEWPKAMNMLRSFIALPKISLKNINFSGSNKKNWRK